MPPARDNAGSTEKRSLKLNFPFDLSEAGLVLDRGVKLQDRNSRGPLRQKLVFFFHFSLFKLLAGSGMSASGPRKNHNATRSLVDPVNHPELLA